MRSTPLIVIVFALAGVTAKNAAPPPPALQGVQPLFDPADPDGGPFPSDAFTVPDATQVTGRRVNLPSADCAQRPSDCEDIALLNTFDGFNLRTRVSIPFSGAIDVTSVSPKTVFLVRLGDATGSGSRTRADGRVIGLNQIVWDTATNTLHGFADESLAEHARYAIIVTRGLRAASRTPVEVSGAFRRFRDAGRSPYRQALGDGLAAARRSGVGENDVAVAGVFTTQTASHIIARMRDAVQSAPAPRLEFSTIPGGTRAVFAAGAIESLTANADINPGRPLTDQPMAQLLASMRVIPGAVGTVAFGTFRTLDFTTRAEYIAPIPTRTGTLAPTGTLDVAFDLWLPAGTRPKSGWPVVIYGHGSFGSKDTAYAHAAVMASHGLAVISMNAIGRGRGPRSMLTVRFTDGTTTTFATPGLGRDTNGDGTIDPWEPRRARRPYAVLNTSGPILQAVSQHFALVRAIQAGVDVDADGAADLDASRIYYLGQSLGAMWGMWVFANEPAIRAAVFTVPAGTLIYNTTFGPTERSGLGEMLAARQPSLVNPADGLTNIDGVAVAAPHFNENLPLRNEPVRVNAIRGAMDIQRVVDRIAWAAQACSTVAAAPLLRRAPLPRAPARPFLFQWARSDQFVPNPSAAELVRAGGFADRTVFYRHDRNFIRRPMQPNPHGFLSAVLAPNLSPIALAAQDQVGTFFESDGAKVVHPEPPELWEVPIRGAVPEDLFYLPRR